MIVCATDFINIADHHHTNKVSVLITQLDHAGAAEEETPCSPIVVAAVTPAGKSKKAVKSASIVKEASTSPPVRESTRSNKKGATK